MSTPLHYPTDVPTHIPPVTDTLDKLLPNAARAYPKRIAIDFLGRTLTYEELDLQVRKATSALYRCGVRKGDVVALILPNCPQHIVALYATLALGATVAEHNPLAPPAELQEQLERHGATVVIAWEQTIETLLADGDFHGRSYLSVDLSAELPLRSRLLLKLPVQAARESRAALRGNVPAGVLSFDRITRKAPPMSDDVLTDKPELDDIAVLIHTGGTTGSPKAVMLTHRNLVSNAHQTASWVPALKEGKETFVAVLPFFHAFGLGVVLGVGVLRAATMHVLPKFDVPALIAAHRRRPITIFPGVPPIYKRFLDGVKKEQEAGKDIDLSSITLSFAGAMPVSQELSQEWEEATGGLMVEGYGMSEASPLISGNPSNKDRRPGTLGIPFPSTEVRIADVDDLSKDAEGIGEILARGPQVFAGYFDNEEETEKVFYEGWLRTGDLAYWDDGFLVMADRAKEMIINSGFNVYPSQVEDAIKTMPGVRDVAVVGMPADERGESVVAALVLEPGAAVDLAAVRRWTQDKISHYAMPKSIAVFDDLPRSQLGKVQRRSVREELADFELQSGVWKKKASELGEAVSDRWESFTASLTEHAHATREQVHNWLEEKGYSADELQSWFANHKLDTEELKERLAAMELSREDFSAWLSRSAEALKARSEEFLDKRGSHANSAQTPDESAESAE
ncbi:MAG: AMP-binding protein [Actinomycetaceae bacterium]|nr:AMP-binding protein [Actinomycetaceae bacterium]